MSEVGNLFSEIEKLKDKIQSDLFTLSQHFEKLGKTFQSQDAFPKALRCHGHMRTVSALMRGVKNLRVFSLSEPLVESESIDTPKV